MTQCACGSNSAYTDCCQPIIDGQRAAESAEELIRARYTAHTIANMGFILKTHHPSSRSDIDEVATAKWARESEWLGLKIIDIDESEQNLTRIEFTASYRDVNKERHTHHELGIFEKYNGQWFFKDAEVPEVQQFRRSAPKQGRNDPCACGSGKKFKKCCGAAA